MVSTTAEIAARTDWYKVSNVDDVLPFEQRKAIVRGYASTAGFAREQVNKAA